MTEGPVLLIILLISVFFIVILTSKFRVHPFLVLLLAAIGVGISTGLPMQQIVDALKSGFGNTLGGIGNKYWIRFRAEAIGGSYIQPRGTQAWILAYS